VVVVDGVGYPSVGSICGVSNGDTSAALGSPVLLVGKSGVGDAVDSFNLNAAFFESKGSRVLGGVFNRLSQEGFYSLERCKKAVTSYFAQAKPDSMPYGFVPEVDSLKDKRESLPPSSLPPPATAFAATNTLAITAASPVAGDGAVKEAQEPGLGLISGRNEA
ncbi:unnamed protein product, partial [Choristocarpus tenellus]